MKTAFFSTKAYDRQSFESADSAHEITFHETRLTKATASLACGFPAVCVFVNDVLDRDVLSQLADHGLKVVVLRCAGFNNVDLEAAADRGIVVARVPAYSPHAVAEHTFALILSLNRRLHKAYARVREGDFRLNGLLGFDLFERTIGVIGTGTIGACVCRIARGFGCRVLAHDLNPSTECTAAGVTYVDQPTLLAESDIVTLHCPLVPETHYLINDEAIAQMKPGVMLINTSRGGIVETQAVIRGLKSGHLGGLGIDVYEEEADLFFEDLSGEVIRDDVFARLLTFPNVLITGHQGFFTADALEQIASTTLQNLTDLESSGTCPNCVAHSAGDARK
ncbi:MAG: 2-hydroxyacid dehydrogenase [Planctomycetaceae bacterium]|nr:2-hydroxyacid dehydrogenase [Planctomycetaceae bacterium]